MTAAKHADFEALSAFVDGEAPEWADHVAGCEQCRATAAELRALSAKVAAPGDSPPAAQREAAIAAALASLEATVPDAGVGRPVDMATAFRHAGQRDRSAGRWSPQRWAMPAVAAVVLACLGFAGMILSSTRSTDHTNTLAGPAFDSKSESAVAGAPGALVGDLGDVTDAATLRERALGPPPPAAAAGRSSSSSANSAATSDAGSGASPPPAGSPLAQSGATNAGATGAASAAGGSSAASGGSGGAAAVAPSALATRPCEQRVRSREPGLGPVTYFATARRGTVPAYVLGFATNTGQVTLLMLAQGDCSELLRSVGP